MTVCQNDKVLQSTRILNFFYSMKYAIHDARNTLKTLKKTLKRV
jgi:hypothetical protein